MELDAGVAGSPVDCGPAKVAGMMLDVVAKPDKLKEIEKRRSMAVVLRNVFEGAKDGTRWSRQDDEQCNQRTAEVQAERFL